MPRVLVLQLHVQHLGHQLSRCADNRLWICVCERRNRWKELALLQLVEAAAGQPCSCVQQSCREHPVDSEQLQEG